MLALPLLWLIWNRFASCSTEVLNHVFFAGANLRNKAERLSDEERLALKYHEDGSNDGLFVASISKRITGFFFSVFAN
jgi:hypothetical protein